MHYGSCLCGHVQYEADEIAGDYVYCHCPNCQKASGSAFSANVSVPIGSFRVTSGEALLHTFESSPGNMRYFCSRCGSPLFAKLDEGSVVRVRLGSLDSQFEKRCSAHIFTSRKARWYEIKGDARQFDIWPDAV